MNHSEARALIERQARAWERGNVAAILADFAPDGVLISPGGQWRGHPQLRAAAEAFFATVTAVHVTITRVLLDGDQGAVEWTWSETRRANNQTYTAEDAIIFVLRDGQIVFWREYIDTSVSRLPLQPASS
jgi:uncharacterized protein (TIGR02246 family)